MQCQECKENGISSLNKAGLIFDLGVQCTKCGAEYRLRKGLALIISLLTQVVILLSIVYAFVYMEAYIAYIGIFLGLALVGAIGLLLPMRKQSGPGFKHDGV